MIEGGTTYDQLRGVTIEGTAHLIEDTRGPGVLGGCGQRVRALQRSVQRGDEAVRRHHDEQAHRGAGRPDAGPLVGPPQARRTADAAGRQHRRIHRGPDVGGDLIIRGGEVVDGTGAAAVRADVRVRDGAHRRGRRRPRARRRAGDRRRRARSSRPGSSTPTPTPIRRCSGTRRSIPSRCTASRRCSSATAACRCSRSTSRPAATSPTCSPTSRTCPATSSTTACRGRGPTTPATATRSTPRGAGINLAALVGHSPLRLAVMGDDGVDRARPRRRDRARWRRCSTTRCAAGAWGLSTSFLDVDQHGRPVPSRAADERRVRRAVRRHRAQPAAGSSSSCPACSATTPRCALERARSSLRRRAASRSRGPGFVHADSNPAATQKWIDLADRARRGGRPHLPAAVAADRRLPPQLGLVDDVHVDARGLAQGDRRPRRRQAPRCSHDPAWRAAARDEWDRTEKAMFPHRRPETVRFVEVFGAENEPWLGRTLAELVAERGGHPSDVFADFVLANDCRPGVVAVGIANADVDGVARTLADPGGARSARPTPAPTCRCCARRATPRCCSPATSASAATSRSSRRCTSSPAARPTCSASPAGA